MEIVSVNPTYLKKKLGILIWGGGNSYIFSYILPCLVIQVLAQYNPFQHMVWLSLIVVLSFSIKKNDSLSFFLFYNYVIEEIDRDLIAFQVENGGQVGNC